MSRKRRWPKAAAWARDEALMALSVAARVLDDLMGRWGEMNGEGKALALGRALAEVRKALLALQHVQGPLADDGEISPRAAAVFWDAWRGAVDASTVALAQETPVDGLPDDLANLVKGIAGGNLANLDGLRAWAQDEARALGWVLGGEEV